MASFEFLILPNTNAKSKKDFVAEENDVLIYHGLCEIFFDLAVFPCCVRIRLTNPSRFLKLEHVSSPNVILAVWEDLQKANAYSRQSRCVSVWVSSLRLGSWNPALPVSWLECFSELQDTARLWLQGDIDAGESDDDNETNLSTM